MTEKQREQLTSEFLKRVNDDLASNLFPGFTGFAGRTSYQAEPKPPELKMMGEVKVLSTKIHYPAGSTRRN